MTIASSPASLPDAASPLPRDVRAFIVLLAVLQGGLLYLADTGLRNGWWPFSELGGRVCWYTLVLAVPTLMSLSVARLGDRRFWLQAAVVAGLFLLLAAWAAWSASGAPGLRSAQVLGPFGITVGIGLFVALPWLQCRLMHGSWRAPYAELVEHAWQNALTLLLAAMFTGICWAVLHLWAALFELVNIDLFRRILRERPVIYLATGIMVGLGILIGRTQHRPVQVARLILFAVFKGLLPLLAFIALLFVAVLPFTGLEPLWRTRSAASILICLLALLVLFVNAVYQDGQGGRPYPPLLRRLVEGGLLALPVFAVLALYALWLRVAQYGWTTDRFWAVLIALVLSGHAFGYAWAVLRGRSEGWLAPVAGVNKALSWGVIVLAVLVNSPLLDPLRLAAASQSERLRAGTAEQQERDYLRDLEVLRFDLGRQGYRAAEALRDQPPFAGDAHRLAVLERVLQRRVRYEGARSAVDLADSAVKDVAEARALIRLAENAAQADEAWLEALLNTDHQPALACLQADSRCVLLTPDLDGDGDAEHLLCDTGRNRVVQCSLWARAGAAWQLAGRAQWHGDTAEVTAALEAGSLDVQRRRWPDLEAAGRGARLDELPRRPR
ncbi:DUF4153 domain-containing protein [Pseudothauera nasutitermitis]|uniref:DUF4153 domain-containing protein n=1 Tax=Pseudothauera nasutitermitis TaxID=2565930 RepID=A0A4V3WBV6_9RHOO|nr:DUF4153 domain-containing protein [Pseudothauera nasutitermitis]THF64709.1 DUF4153 domain-containing protein [Pseudothauera nasutitermitis]